MSIIRAARPQTNFYILDKRISEDRGLSWAARGLLIFLLGKPDHWKISIDHLRKETESCARPTGRDAVYGLLNEIISGGYIKRMESRDEKGRVSGYDYIVFDEPITLGIAEDEPLPEKPLTDEPLTANTTLVSTDVKQERKKARIQLELPDWLPKESWDGFMEMRQKIRKPLTDRAVGMIVKKLAGFKEAGQDVAAILDQSVVKSWQDVFPVRQQFEQKADKPREAPWWSSNEAMLKKGRELGMAPRSGESWQDFRGRIDSKISKGGEAA